MYVHILATTDKTTLNVYKVVSQHYTNVTSNYSLKLQLANKIKQFKHERTSQCSFVNQL